MIRRRPGRPRSASRTGLVSGLTARQDAIAARSARRLWDLRRGHVARAHVRAAWPAAVAVVAAALAAVLGWADALAAAASDLAHVERVLTDRVRALLTQLSQSAPAASASSPAHPPHLRPSTSLTAARGRSARLMAKLVDAQEQVVTGEILPVAVVETALAERVTATRAGLLAWSTTLPDHIGRAAVRHGAPGVREVLRRAVDRSLAEYARALVPETPARSRRRSRKESP